MAKPKVEVMPAECCGVCSHGHYVDKDYMCFGNAPRYVFHEDRDIEIVREVPTELRDYPCALFKLRMQS